MINKSNKETLPSKENLTNELFIELQEEARYYLDKRKNVRNQMAHTLKRRRAVHFKLSIATDVREISRLSEALRLFEELISTCQEMIDICDKELKRITNSV
jgi:hypothetical protein